MSGITAGSIFEASKGPVISAGLNDIIRDMSLQVHWNEGYRVPKDVVEGDVCDYPLARNLILMLVAVGSKALLRYVLEGKKENYSITLRDMRINLEAD